MNINDSDLQYYVPFKDIELNIQASTIHIKNIYTLEDFFGTETNISNKNICYVKYLGEKSNASSLVSSSFDESNEEETIDTKEKKIIDTIYFNLIDTSEEAGFNKKKLIDIDIEKKPLSDIIKIESKIILNENLVLKDNNGNFYFINKGDTQDDNSSISNKFLKEFKEYIQEKLKEYIQEKLEDFKNCNCFKDNEDNQSFEGSKKHFSTDK